MRMLRLLPILLLLGAPAGVWAMRKPAKAPPAPPLFLPNGDPNISAAGAIAIDAESGKVLWEKDAETPRYMASTTKIMTAMLLIEHSKLDDVIVAPPLVDKIGESSMHLKPGEKVKVNDMLYALMLRSANDGCVAVANHVAGSVPKFVDLMNARAKAIGCKHTHFANPNGLHDENHFTSAHDLALITREAMRLPTFRSIVKTWKHEIDRSIDVKDRWMINRNKWLKKDMTADGVKTGFTIPAGHCYVGSATRNGWRVITVLLNSPHWQLDHQALLHWSFDKFAMQTIAESGKPLGEVMITSGVAASAPLVAEKTVRMAVRKGAAEPTISGQVAAVVAPVRRGVELGAFVARDADGYQVPIKVCSAEDVAGAPIVGRHGKSNGLAFVLGALALGGGAYAMKRRAKRKMRLYAQ